MRTIKIILILSLIFYPSFNFVFSQDLREEAIKHYEKGKEYYQQAKYKEAEEEFQNALLLVSQEEKKPTYPDKENIAQAPKVSEYIIGEDDVLFITVWQEKDLSQEVSVQPDGKISFPLAGEIPVSGSTTSQLKEEITKRLKEYIKAPVISVSLRKIGGRRAIILGEVATNGVYPITGTTTLLELIALAGGFTTHSVPSSTILIRGGFQNPKGMRLNLRRAINKAVPNQNLALQPGDIIFVPKKFIADVNYFTTQLLGPVVQGAWTYESIERLQ